ncbi:Aste57867_479 [Aphanomyces stellatus]|uniref:Aste57867_479 protein n=1 Tax=Aphanomyces stellatus TaxID=120398 RepID=A0A485K6U8_9STRA|nr:hypothetical protein As57867_000478 [Aphanomyces stellatus]VFT77704.1 Aste57867_479 [Aphanomyces stellatus]
MHRTLCLVLLSSRVLGQAPAWPPAGQCSVPGLALWTAQCPTLTAGNTPITVTQVEAGTFQNVNMSSLNTLDEARAVLQGASAVNAMKGMRSENFDYYNNSLRSIMIVLCKVTSTDADLQRCVSPSSPYAQRNGGNQSSTCLVMTDAGNCAAQGLCERLPNCMWNTVDPTQPRLPRYSADDINAANQWVSSAYAKSLAPYAGPGVAFAVLTALGFFAFFILRCFFNKCGGRDPVERGYTWCAVMFPGVAFFIFSLVIFICSVAAYVQNNTVTTKMASLFSVLNEVINNLNVNTKYWLTPIRQIQADQQLTVAQVQSILASTSWVPQGGNQLLALGQYFDQTYTTGFPSVCVGNGQYCLACPPNLCGTDSIVPRVTLAGWKAITDQLDATFQLTRDMVYSGPSTVFSATNAAEDVLTVLLGATNSSGTTVNSIQSTFNSVTAARTGGVLGIFVLGLFVSFLGMIGFLKGICKDKTKWVNLLHVSWALGVILCIVSFTVASTLVAVSAVWYDGCQYLDMVMNNMTPYFSAGTSAVVGSCVQGTSVLAALGMTTTYGTSCEITERYRVAQSLQMTTRLATLASLSENMLAYRDTNFGYDVNVHKSLLSAAATAMGSDMPTLSKSPNYAVLESPWMLFSATTAGTCTTDVDPPACYMKLKCNGSTTACYTAYNDARVYTAADNKINAMLLTMRQDFTGAVNSPNSPGWPTNAPASILDAARTFVKQLDLFLTQTIKPVANLDIWTQVDALQCTAATGCGWINQEYAMVHSILCQDLLGACLNIALSVFINALFLLPMAICGIILQKRLRGIRGGSYGNVEAPAAEGQLTGRQKLEKKLEALAKGQTTL